MRIDVVLMYVHVLKKVSKLLHLYQYLLRSIEHWLQSSSLDLSNYQTTHIAGEH